jgi:peptidoglycan-N-acetylmuramic acid deacetylase
LEVAKENDLKTMMWSIAIKDWGKAPIDATSSAQKIIKRIHPGAIILLHITNAGTPKMLEQLIPMLKDSGYEVASHEKL